MGCGSSTEPAPGDVKGKSDNATTIPAKAQTTLYPESAPATGSTPEVTGTPEKVTKVDDSVVKPGDATDSKKQDEGDNPEAATQQTENGDGGPKKAFITEETKAESNDNVSDGNDNAPSQSQLEEVADAATANDEMQTKPPQSEEQTTEVSAEDQANAERLAEQKKIAETQDQFSAAVRCACLQTKTESVLERATESVYNLQLQRSLPYTLSVFSLMQKLPHLQELDVSENQMGPHAFRCLMFAMSSNQTIVDLNVANNHTDTDSADSVGIMLQKNSTLISLNLGSNYLGKDYLSRCIGPALAKNNTLQNLNCEAVGSVDFSALMEGACSTCTLVSLNLNHNTMSKSAPFVQHLISCLQNPNCGLSNIELKNCGLKDGDLLDIIKALKNNSSLVTLDLSSNQVSSSKDFVDFLLGCMGSPSIKTLVLDNLQIAQVGEITEVESLTQASGLKKLSLSGCQLSDSVMTSLIQKLPEDGLCALEELNLSNNQDLSTDLLKQVLSYTKGQDGQSSLQKLSYGQNNAENLASVLAESDLSNLVYLNLRRAKISPPNIAKLGDLTRSGGIETIILDNIKIANTECIKHILAGGSACSLVALSLTECSLTDKDMAQVADALKDGLQLTMVKLSSNRIGDKGVRLIVDGLLAHPTHPLKLMDFSNNRLGNPGAEALADLLISSSHQSQIHSLNVSRNNIAGPGMQQLVSVVSPGKLSNLIANNQNAQYAEQNIDDIYRKLAQSLGMGTDNEEGSCPVPAVPATLTVKLDGLGGFAGELGRMLDSLAITTDHRTQIWPYLTMTSILEISANLRGQDNPDCMFTTEEWDNIIGASKGAPRWLQLSDHRERAVYMTHLPAAITPNKLEGILEMEADCNVDEVVLLKDQLTQKNNGLAWVLLSDVASVERAVEFFKSGEAKVFGQSFMLSRVNLDVENDGNETHAAARAEMQRRAADRAKEEASHRQFIRQSYNESQARHAYRLAHPAYADGRIW